MTLNQDAETIEQGIKMLEAYEPGTTLGDVILINIRKGEAWAARCWVHSRKRRGPFSMNITTDRIWCELVLMAAKFAGDWTVDKSKDALDGVRPRKIAKIRTREALVGWFVLQHTDIALAIDDDAWNAIDV